MRFQGTKYKLMNVGTGRVFEDRGWMLADPEASSPSLVRAVYENKKFTPRDDLKGLYRYAEWMPINRTLRHSCAPVTYHSKGLGKFLGLDNLYITFSGYNPKIGAKFQTCSFKETEAFSVCARLDRKEKRTLVVQSAGNTARAFAQVCSDNLIPIVICVPLDNRHDLWFQHKLNPCVKLVASPAGSDYYDAIALGDKLCQDSRYFAEGGAKNVARRDGMGTTLLSAVEAIGRIPDAYFQAVGSGTGAIAAWENNLRLIEDGRFGSHKMKIFVAQNKPFTLLHDSWQAGKRELAALDPDTGRRQAESILAKVLSNREQRRHHLLDTAVPQSGRIRHLPGSGLCRTRPCNGCARRQGGQRGCDHAQHYRRRLAGCDGQGISSARAFTCAQPRTYRRRDYYESRFPVLEIQAYTQIQRVIPGIVPLDVAR